MTNEQTTQRPTSDPHVVVVLTIEQAVQVAAGAIGGSFDGATIGGTHACCSGQLNAFQNLVGEIKPT
jgi:hypothetical protein